MRAALAAAGVAPAQIGYVEAHGTGTSLGDPIEVNALGAVLARRSRRRAAAGDRLGQDQHRPPRSRGRHRRPDQGGAGAAAARDPAAPALHDAESAHRLGVAADHGARRARRRGRRSTAARLAGVSSFGFSGTNAHVMLEEAPVAAPRRRSDGSAAACCWRCRRATTRALADRASAHRAQLAGRARRRRWPTSASPPTPAARTSRSASPCTAPAPPSSTRRWPRGSAREPHPALVDRRSVGADAPRVAFLFPGQGPQYVGHGPRAVRDARRSSARRSTPAATVLDPLLPQPLRP